eukprot:gene2047-3978_t
MEDHAGKSKSKAKNIKDVVSALESVILAQKKDGHKLSATPTEIFAAILSAIFGNTNSECIAELLEILEAVIPQASTAIVISQFKALSTALIRIAKSAQDDKKIMRGCVGALGALMCAQEASDGFWSGLLALQTVNALLTYIDDPRKRVRKSASDHLTKILIRHQSSNCNSLRSYISEFANGVMKGCTRSEYRRSLFVIIFLESAGALLPDSHKLCHTALQLQACEQPILTAAAFRMIDAIFQNPNFSMTVTQTNEFVKNLMNGKPATIDMEANTYFFTALASSLVRLQRLSAIHSAPLVPVAMTFLVEGCETDFTQIHCAIGTALKRIITACVDKHVVVSRSTHNNDNNDIISYEDEHQSNLLINTISALEPILRLRNQNSWIFVMDGLRCLYERLQGSSMDIHLDSITRQIGDIYQAVDTQAIVLAPGLQVAIGDTLGIALRSLGIVHFLRVIPLRTEDTPAYAGIDTAREWLLNLFHSNLRLIRCSLSDFMTVILGAARTCSQALKTPGTLLEWHRNLARRRILQLWSLFPDFCMMGTSDIPLAFPRFVKTALGAMQDPSYPELLPIIASGLFNIVTKARERCPRTNPDSPDISVLKQHAEGFLPLFLTTMETMDVSHRNFQSCVQCIGAWADVSPPSLLTSLSKRLLQLLLSSTVSNDSESASSASGWMAVMLVVIPHLPATLVNLLYRTIRPLLSVQESLSLQKRAYLVLDALLQQHANIMNENEARIQMFSVISESLLLSHVSARHMRLRCMETLMEDMSEEELNQVCTSVLGEVLICQKDANKKSRDAAVVVLRVFAKRVEPRILFTQLCSAVVAETTLMRSSAVIGLCLLAMERRQEMWLLEQLAQLVNTLVLLLKEECAEQTRAILTYLRVCVSVLPVQTLTSVMGAIVEATLGGLGQHKSKFVSRERAIIRKLSQRVPVDDLRPLLPEGDVALLSYIQKQARRSKRRKETREEEKLRQLIGSDDEAGNSSDEESEGEDKDYRLQRTKATRAMDVVDSFNLPSTLDDLLEDQGLTNTDKVFNGKAGAHDDDSDDEGYSVKLTAEGNLIVEEKEETNTTNVPLLPEKIKEAFKSKQEREESIRSTNQATKKRRMKEPGEEYRSKKAGGDVWRSGMLEPHAYIPLDARLLSKKNHKEAVSHFGAVVSNGKKKKRDIKPGSQKPGKNGVMQGNRNQRKHAKLLAHNNNADDEN